MILDAGYLILDTGCLILVEDPAIGDKEIVLNSSIPQFLNP